MIFIYWRRKHRPRGATVARSTPDRKVIRSNRVGVIQSLLLHFLTPNSYPLSQLISIREYPPIAFCWIFILQVSRMWPGTSHNSQLISSCINKVFALMLQLRYFIVTTRHVPVKMLRSKYKSILHMSPYQYQDRSQVTSHNMLSFQTLGIAFS